MMVDGRICKPVSDTIGLVEIEAEERGLRLWDWSNDGEAVLIPWEHLYAVTAEMLRQAAEIVSQIRALKPEQTELK
jgi:hypothetical protein